MALVRCHQSLANCQYRSLKSRPACRREKGSEGGAFRTKNGSLNASIRATTSLTNSEILHRNWTTPKGTGSPRLTEIEDWILSYRLDEVILVLDDESGWSLYGSHLDRKGFVVLCKESRGFNAAQLALAQKLLRAQLSYF